MSQRRSEPRIATPILVGLFVIVLAVAILVRAGLPFFVIIGGSAAIAYVAWLATTYKKPVNPKTILPLYLLALAAQVVHTVEEYAMDFPGEIAAAFGSPPLGREAFVIAVMGGFAALWILTAFGLIYRSALANYLLWFFVVGPGVVSAIAHLSFPFIGDTVYFPGLITVILPTIMSILVIRALILGIGKAEGTEPAPPGPRVPSD